MGEELLRSEEDVMIASSPLTQEPNRPFGTISPANIAEIRDLYFRGMCLQALAKAAKFGPLPDWTDPDACLIGGRIAGNLGGGGLARKLHFRAYRHHRDHAEAQYYYALAVFEARGPL